MTPVAGGRIRKALVAEAAALHALTGRSALHWGYEPEFLEWEPESIAVTPELIASATVYVLEDAGRMLGYYALGTGCGKRLWLHAVTTARELGAVELLIAADPNASPFYRAMGAVWEREETTTRPGWNLQFLRYPLPIESQGA